MPLRKLSTQENPAVGTVLASIVRYPFRTIALQWNFKAAILSALFRGAVFLVAIGRSHRAGSLEAVLVEVSYASIMAGIVGALTQSLRSAQPAWMAETLLFLVFPLSFQLLECAVHALFGTAVFRAGLFASAALTGLSALFHLFVMRRGALLIGQEGKTFAEDLWSLPGLALAFVLEAPQNLAQFIVRLWPFPLAGARNQQ